MITKEQIDDIETFHLPTLHEALRQAELRLSDCFRVKENIEKKAFILLSIFLSFSMLLFSIPKILGSEQTIVYLATIPTGLTFLLGAIFLFNSLKSRPYGTLGRCPDTWLHKDILAGDDNTEGRVLAYVLYDYQEKIEKSEASHEEKIKLVDKGIYCGICAPIVFLLCLGF